MADPYFNPQSIYLKFQKAYESVMSGNRLVLNDWPQQSSFIFGLQVEQAAPNQYLKTLVPGSKDFHNPFNDSRFKKKPVRVISSGKTEPIAPSGLSKKPMERQQANENTQILANQSELSIDRVWNMAGEASFDSQLNTNPPAHTSTLNDTAENSFSDLSQSTLQNLSVIDIEHNPYEITDPDSEQIQLNKSPKGSELDFIISAPDPGKSLTISPEKPCWKAYAQSEKRKASQKAYAQSEKGKATRKAYEQSEKRKASQKAYEQSEKGKATRKAYKQSKNRKASHKSSHKSSQKAYAQSEKGKATQKAYEQSEKRKAAKQAWARSEKGKAYFKNYRRTYQKAYYKALRNTGGDQEQAKIASKQTLSLIKKSNKTKGNAIASTSIAPPPDRFSD